MVKKKLDYTPNRCNNVIVGYDFWVKSISIKIHVVLALEIKLKGKRVFLKVRKSISHLYRWGGMSAKIDGGLEITLGECSTKDEVTVAQEARKVNQLLQENEEPKVVEIIENKAKTSNQ